MIMRFKARSEYSDLVGGTLHYGSGIPYNVHEELQAGNGVIETDNPNLQQVLSEYWGAHGPVFDVVTVENGQETLVERPVEPDPTAKAPVEATEVLDAKGVAQHTDQSGYALLPLNELQQIAEVRGIKLENNASKDSIISLIEKHDAAEAAGTGA